MLFRSVLALIDSAHAAGLRLAIATTTSPVNIAVLLRNAIGPDWKSLFAVIEDASTAPRKKPHPQVYTQTLSRLGLQGHEGLAFEDSYNGLHAMKTAAYEHAVQSGAVQLRPGVLALIESAHAAGLRLAIATTTSPVNIAVLLRNAIGPDWKSLFAVIEEIGRAHV